MACVDQSPIETPRERGGTYPRKFSTAYLLEFSDIYELGTAEAQLPMPHGQTLKRYDPTHTRYRPWHVLWRVIGSGCYSRFLGKNSYEELL